MKKTVLLAAFLGMVMAGFAQTQKLNRTNTKKKTTDTTTVVLPTIQREHNSTGVNGIDGSINDPDHSGQNKSSTIAPPDTTRR